MTLSARSLSDLQAALEQVGIVSARWGAARQADLSEAESALYIWLLGRFAAGEPPTQEQVASWAATRDIDHMAVLGRLVTLDLLQWESPDGEVTVIYPFSRTPTPHQVRVEQAAPVYAMCAVDALGIAFLLGRPVTVESQDGWTGDPLQLIVEATGHAEWDAPAGRVLLGAARSEGSVACCCCPVIRFFTTADHAEAYIAREQVTRATLLTLEEALTVSKLLFGGVLTSQE